MKRLYLRFSLCVSASLSCGKGTFIYEHVAESARSLPLHSNAVVPLTHQLTFETPSPRLTG
jgi:hypothetical protein